MINTTNEASKRAAIIDHLDKSMFVEAGAGAGKTTKIVERNIAQIKSGKWKATDIVNITFTNAAAEELRDRLMKGLHKAAEEAVDELEKNRLLEAIRDESLFQISTIHSFCKRLLTEQSFAAKLPMDVKLLDASEAIVQKKAFFEDWYQRQDVTKLQFITDNFPYGYVGIAIENLFLEIAELPEDTEIVYDKTITKGNDIKTYMSAMKQQIADVFDAIYEAMNALYPARGYTSFDQIVQKVGNSGSKTVSLLLGAYREMYELLKGAYSDKDFISTYKKCAKYFSEGKGFSKNIKTAFDFSNAEVDELNAQFFGMGIDYTDHGDEVEIFESSLIIEMAVKAREEYRAFCRLPENRHEITNDAILQEALELVTTNQEAREYFQRKFSCIYVDEFQDTDRVQRDLILALCENPDKPGELKEGSFFFVGDPKQSIYAFRGADVEIYEDTRKKYEDATVTDVEVYSLDDNYRSEQPVVDWVNTNFKTPFNGVLSAGYSDMNASNNNAATASDGSIVLNGVYTLDYPKGTTKAEAKKENTYETAQIYPSVEAAKSKETDMLVALINNLVDQNYKIWKPTGEKKEDGKPVVSLQPIEYKDFLILCQNKDTINAYADKLKKAGILVNLYGALDTENDDVLIRTYQLYHYLTFPMNKKARHGAMQVMLSGRVTAKNAVTGQARLNLLREKTKYMTSYEMLEFLTHHMEYVVKEKMTGEQMITAKSRLQQLYEAMIVKPIGNCLEMDRMISEYMQSEVDKELSMDKNANAVRFMNLHKAKGLEGNIVIVVARKPRVKKVNSYRDGNKYYPVVKAGASSLYATRVRSYVATKDASGNAISDLAETKEKAEWLRQDYVEVTRPKEVLILMDAWKSKSVLDDFVLNGTVNNLLDTHNQMRKDVDEARNGKYKIEKKATSTRKYNTNANEVKLKEKQTYRQRRDVTPSAMEHSDRSTWKPETENRPCGDVFGTVLHRVFELLVKQIRKGVTTTPLAVVNQAIMENYLDITIGYVDAKEKENEVKSYRDYLMNRVDVFLKDTKLITDIKSAKAVYTEMEFAQLAKRDEIRKVNENVIERLDTKFSLDDKESYWINGQADLVLVMDNDQVQIIDYKSDRKGKYSIKQLDAHLSYCYDHQQELYRFTVSQALKIPVKNISFRYYHMYMDEI